MQETIPEYTVSEISFAIKRTMEDAFARVRVRGEIFGCKRADSGHYYLSLKDENANLSAVCWKGVAAGLKVKPEDGLEVVAAGRITTFAGKSSYQLVIEQMEVAGAGALLKLLEERKQKFAAEGLFDPAHKKPIPFLPRVIGVVTSPAGAVIRDIIHRVTDRFPVRIIVWPTLVQGEGAAEQIAAAVNGFNRLPADGPVPRPDLLIVARGGGSLEDLWCFNEEIVIRAVYDSEIPLISACSPCKAAFSAPAAAICRNDGACSTDSNGGSPTWNKFFLKTCKSWTTGANACGSVLKITWKTGKTGLI